MTNPTHINYTFTFGKDEEKKFKRILERLEPEEYTVVKDIFVVDPEHMRESELSTVMEMDPESALTFRLGMKYLTIRRFRTEEELAEEKALDDQNTVRITVVVPQDDKK